VGERINRKSPVGGRLREARLRAGISQKGLGILAGIDEFSASSRINQYERNKHVPDFSISKRLARSLKVPVTYLYADEDEIAEMILLYVKAEKPARKQAARILMRKIR